MDRRNITWVQRQALRAVTSHKPMLVKRMTEVEPLSTHDDRKTNSQDGIVPFLSVGACSQQDSPSKVLGFREQTAFSGEFPPVYSYFSRFSEKQHSRGGLSPLYGKHKSHLCGEENLPPSPQAYLSDLATGAIMIVLDTEMLEANPMSLIQGHRYRHWNPC
jgi:hypothetical protein